MWFGSKQAVEKKIIKENPACGFLNWDSDFFGFRIGRVLLEKVDEASLSEALKWCQEEKIQCLYFAVSIDEGESIRLAEKNGFSLVDVRITFERKLPGTEDEESPAFSEVVIRPPKDSDLSFLKEIASKVYFDTRFYQDFHFPRERVDELYRVWIEKSCAGYADKVFVAEKDGRAMGYITCHLQNPSTGSIGLVGVDPEVKGRGIGRELIFSAIRWFKEKQTGQIQVGTQGRNLSAQRLYQRCGFTTGKAHLWYHKWFTHETNDAG
jgi:dTDP-4-amino-4,6-dideoxy-D-galactose acyltransferase